MNKKVKKFLVRALALFLAVLMVDSNQRIYVMAQIIQEDNKRQERIEALDELSESLGLNETETIVEEIATELFTLEETEETVETSQATIEEVTSEADSVEIAPTVEAVVPETEGVVFETEEKLEISDAESLASDEGNITDASLFTYEVVAGNFIEITGYTGTDTEISMPAQIGEYTVSSIGEGAFKNNTTLEKVSLASAISLEMIEKEAFYGCTSLKSIILNTSATEIGESSFAGCSALEEVAFSTSLKTVGHYAFADCLALKQITLPDSVTEMGYRVFENCVELESVKLSSGWTTSKGYNNKTGVNAQGNLFIGCTKLTSVEFPEGMEIIPVGALANCTQITQVTLPSTLENIDDYAFYGMDGLESLTIPAEVRVIGEFVFAENDVLSNVVFEGEIPKLYDLGHYAFFNCTGLQAIQLPDTIERIGYAVFENCTKLETVKYPINLRATVAYGGKYGSIFKGCSSLSEIDIPEGVVVLPQAVFKNCSYLTKIYLPNTLLSIGKEALANCDGLTEIVLPESLEVIAAYAFDGNENLKSIVFSGENLTDIRDYAFSGCVGLTTMALPDSVQIIGYRAFENCSGLLSLHYPVNFTQTPSTIAYMEGIGYQGNLLKGCSLLKTIVVSEGATVIPAYAFANGASVQTVILSDTVTKIEEGAFAKATSLEQIWIGSSVTEIEKDAFLSCPAKLVIHGEEGSYAQTYAQENGLAFSTETLDGYSVELSGRVVDASGNGLAGVQVLLFDETKQDVAATVYTDSNGQWSSNVGRIGRDYSITFYHSCYRFAPQSLLVEDLAQAATCETVIAEALFESGEESTKEDFTYSVLNGRYASITGYTGEDAQIVIPETIDGYTVQKIGADAFKNHTTLTHILLPDTVTTIDNNAFNGCTNLVYAGLGNGLKTIGESSFAKCTSLEELFLPRGIVTISHTAFADCTGLTSIQLPDGITSLGYHVFEDCINLENVNIPKNWTSSPATGGSSGGIFYGCEKITTLTLPEGLVKIAPNAFAKCGYITEVSIPDSVTEIGDGAFYRATGLTQIEIPASVTTLSSRAFYECSNLKDISFAEGSKVTTLGMEAFSQCTSLEKIVLPDTITSVGYEAFGGCSKLAEVNYPLSWTECPGNYSVGNVFADTAVTTMTIPSGVTSLVRGAFANCKSLTEVVIPDTVETIEDSVFLNCTGLLDITIPASVKTIQASALEGCDGLNSIVIPEGVETLETAAFRNCDNLVSVQLPDTLTGIGSYCFEYCIGLREVNIPDAITVVPEKAFSGCSSLKKIELGSGVTTINGYAFTNCTGLKAIRIGKNVTSIADSAFNNVNKLLTIYGEAGSYAETYATEKEIPFATGEIVFGSIQITGKIVDTEGNGVANAQVVIYDRSVNAVSEICTTDENGTYTYAEGMENHNYTLWFSHPRYQMSVQEKVIGTLLQDTVVEDVQATLLFTEDETSAELFTYKITAGTDIEITGYTGSETVVIVPETIDGYTVTSIADRAFRAVAVTKVLLPDTVTVIGESAFEKCTALETIGLSASLTEIKASAFSGCSALQTIQLPSSLEKIGTKAFYNCSGFTALKLPDSIISIGTQAFANCTGLTEVNYPHSYTESPSSALSGNVNSSSCGNIFKGCTSLTSITIPEGVKTIARYAFANCTSLENVTLPSTLEEVGQGAFYGCTGLTSIALPTGLEIISNEAFAESGLTAVEIPEKVTVIGNSAFYNCDELVTLTIEANGLTSIGQNAFMGCEKLGPVLALPNSVESIGYCAFADCTTLTEINYPLNWTTSPSISTIVSGAGYQGNIVKGCEALTAITIPEGVVEIAPYAFANCTNLKNVSLPSTVETIGKGAFYGNTGIESIEIPASVLKIDVEAFRECTALTDIIYAENPSINSLEAYAFSGCSSLTEVVLPDTITSLGYQVFANCIAMTDIKLPLNWTTCPRKPGSYSSGINNNGNIISGCTGITSITIPNGMTVPEYAFANCTNLRAIQVEEGDLTSTFDKYSFYGCTGFSSLSLGKGISEIGAYSFGNCTGIVSASIDSPITAIGKEAFAGCSRLGTVRISPSVKDFGTDIFKDCSLKNLVCDYHSFATIYAIDNDIPLVFVNSGNNDSANEVLSFSDSYYESNSTNVTQNGYLNCTVEYKIKDEYVGQISSQSLQIRLPSGSELVKSSLKLNGAEISNYSYSNNILKLTSGIGNAGKLQYSVRMKDTTKILSYALYNFKKGGVASKEIIGIINENSNHITLNAASSISEQSVAISGAAPAQAEITVSVDGQAVETVTASKAGKYATVVSLSPSSDTQTFKLKVSCEVNGVEYTAEKNVYYNRTNPELTDFRMYYNNLSGEVHDLLNLDKPRISIVPGKEFTFVVGYDNPEEIKKVYVTSDKNGEKKRMEAVYDPVTGNYIASGYFDENNTRYVPGNLSVEYTKKLPKVNPNNMPTCQMVYDNYVPSSIKKANVTGSTAEDGKTEIALEVGNYLIDFAIEVSDIDELNVLSDMYDFLTFEYDTVSGRQEVYTAEMSNSETVYFFIDTIDNTQTVTKMVVRGIGGSDMAKLVEDCFDTPGMNAMMFGLEGIAEFFEAAEDFEALKEQILLNPDMVGDVDTAIAMAEAMCFARMTCVIGISGFAVAASLGLVAFPPMLLTVAVGLAYCLVEYMWEIGVGLIMSGKIELFFLIDPSGYVYEGVKSNRRKGVIATIYYKLNLSDTNPILWNAGDYDQINPQITDAAGRYAWDVPEGYWQVKYELDGYETAYSDWLEVPPPHLDVNIGIVAKAAPQIEYLNVYDDQTEIIFSQYMKPESLQDIVLKDEKGNTIPYSLEYAQDETAADGTVLAKEYQFVYTEDGVAEGERIIVTSQSNPENYAGKTMTLSEEKGFCKLRPRMNIDSSVNVLMNKDVTIPFTVENYEGQEISFESDYAAMADVKNVSISEDGIGSLTIHGNISGTAVITANVEGTSIKKEISVMVGLPQVMSYGITFYDGAEPMDFELTEYFDYLTTTLPIPEKEGYDFAGWYDNAEFAGEAVYEIPPASQGEKTFYAKWAKRLVQTNQEVTTLSVEFAGNGMYEYTGAAVKPSVIVRDDKKILTQGVDYTITYANNTQAATTEEALAKQLNAPLVTAQKAPVIKIKGKGNYKSSKQISIPFTIYAKELSDKDAFVLKYDNSVPIKLNKDGSSKEQKLALKITYGKKTLALNKDYLVTYDYLGADGEYEQGTVPVENQGLSSIKDAGLYRVNVKAAVVTDENGHMIRNTKKGQLSNANYVGEMEGFTVYVQQPENVLSKATVKLASKNGIKQGAIVGIEDVLKSISFKEGKKTITYSTATQEDREAFYSKFEVSSLRQLTKNIGTAYLTITAKENSGYYGSKAVAVKIVGTALSTTRFTLDAESATAFTYNGECQVPKYTIRQSADGPALKENVDYKVSYMQGKQVISEDAVRDVGKYTAVYTGIKGYTGTVKKNFTIKQANFKTINAGNSESITATVEAEGALEYSAVGVKPVVHVIYTNAFGNEFELTQEDYSVQYTDNKKLGTAKVTISGKGNFKGTLKEIASFEITKKRLSAEDIKVTVKDMKYGKAGVYKPKVSVLDNGKTVSAKSYTVHYYLDGEWKTKLDFEMKSGETYADITVAIRATEQSNYITDPEVEKVANLHFYTKDLSKAKIILEPSVKYYYSGQQIKPVITSVILTEGKGKNKVDIEVPVENYIINYGENTRAGFGSVSITGTGEYGGTKTIKFTILGRWLKWIFG